MTKIHKQIERIEALLKKGFTVRPTITGGTTIHRRKNDTSIIIRSVEPVYITPGRRRMLELQLAKLRGSSRWLWQSKLADTTVQGACKDTIICGRYLRAKDVKIKGKVFGGTYSFKKHGPHSLIR